jgi:hypothetical protein
MADVQETCTLRRGGLTIAWALAGDVPDNRDGT